VVLLVGIVEAAAQRSQSQYAMANFAKRRVQ
jgi:hypothetical protein